MNEQEYKIGTWSSIPSSMVLDVLYTSGLDFVIVDLEHGCVNYETLYDMTNVARKHDKQLMVRLTGKDDEQLMRVLECGVTSILFPHVSCYDDIKDLVEMCRYPKRGLSPYTPNHYYDDKYIKDSIRDINDNMFIGVLVEGDDYLQATKELSKVREIDMVYTGIYDISQSLGMPGQLDDRKVMDLQEECLEIIQQNGKFAGSFAKDLGYAYHLKTIGFDYVAYSVDCNVLLRGYHDVCRMD